MTENLPASSITQTWQVGPRRSPAAKMQSTEDVEHTQTIFSPRYVFSIDAREGKAAHVLELGIGSHSFFREADDSLGYRSGRYEESEFEINIHKGGAFYVDVRGVSAAKVNGRVCHWARLRSGDQIAFGEDKLCLEYSGPPGMEETISTQTISLKRLEGEGPNAGDQPNRELLQNEERLEPAIAKTSFSSRVTLFLLAGVFMSCVTAYIGYSMAKVQRTKTHRMSQAVIQIPPVPATLSPPRESEAVAIPGRTKPIQISPKVDFETALEAFRRGDKKTACEQLQLLNSTPKEKSVWAKKAALFVERRCK